MIVVCRCEDVTYEDVKKAIEEGYVTLEEIKRVLRCGMGPCQGRTCTRLIAQIAAKETKIPLEKIQTPKTRPPVQPVPFGLFVVEDERDEE